MTSHNTRILFNKPLACCCGDNSITPYKKVDNFQLLKCHLCDLVRLEKIYINPVDFLDDASSISTLEYWGYPAFYQKYEKIFNFFFNERYQRINANLKVSGLWLDIGSGYGLWQKFLTQKGHENFGLEIEKKAVDYSTLLGMKVEHQSIEKYKTTQKYAVITMCDVLEHVEEPHKILKKCYDLLLPGGLLYIQVPSVLGLKYPYGDSLGLPHHLWQFEVAPLINLLKRENFQVIQHWTGIQGVIRFHEAGGPSFIRKFFWFLSRLLKKGNRLQMLVKK